MTTAKTVSRKPAASKAAPKAAPNKGKALPAKTGPRGLSKIPAAKPSRAELAKAADDLLRGKPAKAAPAPAPAPTGRKARKGTLEAAEGSKERPARSRKASVQARTIAEILDGVKFHGNDWRKSLQGKTIKAKPFYAHKDGRLDVTEGKPSPLFLALPRDADVGGAGPDARNADLIACYTGLSEDGKSYVGAPFYLSRDEIKAITV